MDQIPFYIQIPNEYAFTQKCISSYCWVTSQHKFSGFKQQAFVSHFHGMEACALLNWFLCSSHRLKSNCRPQLQASLWFRSSFKLSGCFQNSVLHGLATESSFSSVCWLEDISVPSGCPQALAAWPPHSVAASLFRTRRRISLLSAMRKRQLRRNPIKGARIPSGSQGQPHSLGGDYMGRDTGWWESWGAWDSADHSVSGADGQSPCMIAVLGSRNQGGHD